MTIASVSHFLQIWLFPPGIIVLVLLLGLAVQAPLPRIATAFFSSALLGLWCLSMPIVSQALINGLQHQYPPLPASVKLKEQSAMVILGAGINNAAEYRSQQTLSMLSLSRIHYAAYLYSNHRIPIIASGGNSDKVHGTEAELIAAELNTNYHIPVTLKENKSRNTEQESKLLVPIVLKQHFQVLYLVTSAWHMPRSMFAFQRAFAGTKVTVIPAPMGYVNIAETSGCANYFPLLIALNTSVTALHEYLGILWYKLFYDT